MECKKVRNMILINGINLRPEDKQHLKSCDSCRIYFREHTIADKTLLSLSELQPPLSLKSDIIRSAGQFDCEKKPIPILRLIPRSIAIILAAITGFWLGYLAGTDKPKLLSDDIQVYDTAELRYLTQPVSQDNLGYIYFNSLEDDVNE